ncbi:hypothetical protein D3C80_918330 [compost metagenome]
MQLRPFDKVRNDQEVTRELHAGDNANLVIETFGILFFRISFGKTGSFQPHLQAFTRLSGQLFGFGLNTCLWIIRLTSKARQNGLTRLREPAATFGNFNRVFECFRQISEQSCHFCAAFEMMIRCQTAAIIIGKDLPFGNSKQRVMCLEVFRLEEEGFIGCNKR